MTNATTWIEDIEKMIDDANAYHEQHHPSDSQHTLRLSPHPSHHTPTPTNHLSSAAMTHITKLNLSKDSPTLLLNSLAAESLDSPDTDEFELHSSPEMRTLKTPLDGPPRLALPPLAADSAWAQPHPPSSALSDAASDDTLPIEALTEAELGLAPCGVGKKVGWTTEEDLTILATVRRLGTQWAAIAAQLPRRTTDAVRNRWHRLQKMYGLSDSPAGREALDHLLAQCGVDKDWVPPAECLTLAGSSNSYVRGSEHGRTMWTKEEDQIIADGVRLHGGKWRVIAQSLSGRTDSSVRNRWMRMRKDQMRHEQPVALPVKREQYELPTPHKVHVAVGTQPPVDPPPAAETEATLLSAEALVELKVGATAAQLERAFAANSSVQSGHKKPKVDSLLHPDDQTTGPTSCFVLPAPAAAKTAPIATVDPITAAVSPRPSLKRKGSSILFNGNEIQSMVDFIKTNLNGDEEGRDLSECMPGVTYYGSDDVVVFRVDELSSQTCKSAAARPPSFRTSSTASSNTAAAAEAEDAAYISMPDISSLILGFGALGLVGVAATRLLRNAKA